MSNLDDVKVGDYVVRPYEGFGQPGRLSFYKVTRTTAKQVICDRLRFWKWDGSQVGANGGFHTPRRVRPAAPKDFAAHHRHKAIDRAVELATHENVGRLSDAEIATILGLLESTE